jgi:hypothetical protein
LDVGSESSFRVGHAEAQIGNDAPIAFFDRWFMDV